MKIQRSLVSLMIVFGLLFCVGFACGDDSETRSRTDNDSGATASGLPEGKYACTTTVSVYAGQGGSGSSTYPIYNSSQQTRGEIDVKSNGTYLVGGSSCRYSYDPVTKTIKWQDCAFKEASSSQLTADGNGTPLIQVKFNADKDVWNCTKQ